MKTNRKNIVRTVAAAVFAVTVCSACADTTEVHWYPGGGGDMLEPTHWDNGDWSWEKPGTVPTAKHDACFYGRGEKAVTMSGDLTVHRMRVGNQGEDQKVDIDLGGHTIAFQDDPSFEWGDWNSGIEVNGDTEGNIADWLVFRDGLLSSCCFLKAGSESGGRGANARLTLDNARFVGSRGDIVVGNSATNCTLEILNGSVVEPKRSVVIGLEAGDAAAGHNKILISGTGSKLIAHSKGGDNSCLPNGGSYNQTIVEDGGVYENDLYFENPWWYQATYVGVRPGADHNVFIVRSGGQLIHPGEMRVGLSGSYNKLRVEGAGSVAAFSQSALTIGDTDDGHAEQPGVGNRLEVADGGKVTVGTGNEIWVKVGQGAGADGNVALVTGAGSYLGIAPSLLAEASHPMRFVSVGDCGGCSNALTVADGATLAFDNVYVGGHRDSSCNTLTVTGEGSVLTNTNYDIFIGASDGGNQGGACNALNVEDGGFVYAPRNVFVGMSGVASAVSNTLRIVNGKWDQPVNYDIRLENRARLVWGGSKGSINTPWLHAVDDAELTFVFDEEGIVPFTTRWEMFLVKDDNTLGLSKVTIDARPFMRNHGSGTFELMKALGGHAAQRTDYAALTEDDYARLNAQLLERVECLPSNLQVTADLQHGCLVRVRVPPVGLTIILR